MMRRTKWKPEKKEDEQTLKLQTKEEHPTGQIVP